MSNLAIRNAVTGTVRRNVSMILGMLQGIHDEVADDEVMADVAATVGCAITQLRNLQRLAYQTMIEVESERSGADLLTGSKRKKPN